jgi:glycosyltransferase involved in cell wall biosynthesis
MSALSVVDSLDQLQISRSIRDFPASIQTDDSERSRFLGLEVFDVSLIHVQPDSSFPDAYSRSKQSPRRDIYRIAMWYWEIIPAPVNWRRFAELVQEVWAPSRFIGDTARAILDVPIYDMAPGHRLGEIASISRADFTLPCDRFVFLFMFDMYSTLERKNPLGVIAAFKEAFRRDDKAALVIKVSRSRSNPDGMARLRRAADEVGAIIIDQLLPRAEVNGLLNACDCYVSLHRSEGLGLPLAEAMLLGKPVIATAYSGNLDFMDASNSLLVGHKLVEIEEDVYLSSVYRKGYYWAEPSIAEAARAMRWVFENRDAACELGERARITAGDYFSPEAAGRRMAQRLAQIRQERFGIGCDEKSSLIQA